jgi:DNA ligase 1
MLYKKLAELYQQLENTSKRLEKTRLISIFLKTIPKEDIKQITYLLQGRIFPQWDERKLGMSSKLLVKTIAKATGESTTKIESLWKKLGDLGDVVEELSKNKKQVTLFTKKLTLNKVVENITKITELEGQGTVNKKTGLISELLSYASPLESKYIVRTVTEDLRTGIGDGTLRDSLVWTFYEPIEGIMTEGKETKESRELYNKHLHQVQHAFDMTTDFGLVSITLKEKGPDELKKLNLTVGKPLKVMLYQKVEDVNHGFEVVGKPAIIEPKIDGFRMQIHRKDDNITLYTRRLEDVSKQFPDVIKSVKDNINCKNFILDSEVVGFDSQKKRFVSFQQISQRIKRKYHIEEMIKKLPVVVNIFDAMEINGKNLINEPLEERRKLMQSIIKNKKHELELIEQLVTDDPKQAEQYYQDCLGKGHEGVMMKNLEGIYKPGSRVGFGVKVKPVMESLDLVITEADWGEGKRVQWLSSFTLSCRDDDKLLQIGKVGTGIKEKSDEGVSFEQLTKELKPLIISEKGKSVKVKPKIVVEVFYEEIQKSPKYSSGFALRFPRVVRLRDDKSVSDISTINEITKLYNSQRGRHK